MMERGWRQDDGKRKGRKKGGDRKRIDRSSQATAIYKSKKTLLTNTTTTATT